MPLPGAAEQQAPQQAQPQQQLPAAMSPSCRLPAAGARTVRRRSPYSDAISSTSGAIMRQGPHQGAQKSTCTGGGGSRRGAGHKWWTARRRAMCTWKQLPATPSRRRRAAAGITLRPPVPGRVAALPSSPLLHGPLAASRKAAAIRPIRRCGGARRADDGIASPALPPNPAPPGAHQHRHGRLEHQLIPSAVGHGARACDGSARSGRRGAGVERQRQQHQRIGARCRRFQAVQAAPMPCRAVQRPLEASPAFTLGSAACTRTAARRCALRCRRGTGAAKALRAETRAARAGCAGRTVHTAKLAATAAILIACRRLGGAEVQ